MHLNPLPALAGLVTLALVASCTSGTDGIFASIEKEQKVVHTGNLSTTSTVTHMTEFGANYYAAGGRALFSRPTGSTTWSSTTTLNTGSSSLSPVNFMAVGSVSGALYAIVNTGDSSSNKLYSSPNGSTWTPVTSNTIGSFTPAALVPVRNSDGVTSDELVVTASDFANIWRIGATGTITGPLTLTAGSDSVAPTGAGGNPITAAAKDGSNGYYLVNESFVISVDSGFTTAALLGGTSGISGTKGYRGVLILGSTANGVPAGTYVTTKSKGDTGGSILYMTNTSGTTVTGSGTIQAAKSSAGYPVAFDQMLLSSTGLWIGTGEGTTSSAQEGYGYANYNGSFTMAPPYGTDSSNFTSSNLDNYAIPLLFKGTTGYFIGTTSHGLWGWTSSAKWDQQ